MNAANAYDAELTTTLNTIIELTRTELPNATSLGLVALTSLDLDIAHDMLRRMYGLALDADLSYVASLIDGALDRVEASRPRPSISRS